jgi:hypothetical protein
MNSIPTLSLAEQRQHLRQQLIEQRELIAQQLDSVPDANNEYPRSHTMRFFTRRPTLTRKILTGLITLLVVKK